MNFQEAPEGEPHGDGRRAALEHKSASKVLRAVIDNAEGDSITIGQIIDAFGERAFGFVLILFSLPNCVPAPPGIAGIVGTPVLIFGIQMMLGHQRPWLPGFIMNRSVSVPKFKKIIDAAEPKLQKLESFCSPRLLPLFNVVGDRVAGLFAFLVAVSVLIPFPGTNFPPSIALVIASIAIMEEDGYLLILGYLIGLAGLAYTATVLGASYHLIRAGLSSWFGI
ncbi:exopolysaccharide biosynthesis protein [Microvirga flavescens]|uniref:exopolysaccharide biosynthesis protein n=1 Tax=Microvirga flavescens TaxID=2249811 RepID=UPI000DD92408|nr:exopolysaccharide biosynthesis protein [Microvirga flavescens]